MVVSASAHGPKGFVKRVVVVSVLVSKEVAVIFAMIVLIAVDSAGMRAVGTAREMLRNQW
jgi:hypothetical protein